MERLDENLRYHAETVDHLDIGSIYYLQGLSEVHYYLKAEHEFTPAEVEALLSFQDPLDVARWCWEENTHEHSFPICNLLKEIQAEQKFPKVVNEAEEQNRKYLKLMSLVGKDYEIYQEKLEECSNGELINRAEEIATVMAAYRFLAEEGSLTAEETDCLLCFNRPLVEIVKYWPTAGMNADIAMERFAHGISSTQKERTGPARSLRERLQHAVREVRECPVAEKPAHETGTR
ncbi:hypothetical protein D3Z51_19335 [Clostridiaceae bacterium]|nr:hypothetical protein [Clostridiaceae bacterium]RKI08212.1 hypothetical protein D7V81_19265 [bacterium 1XD21-70]